MIEGRTVTFGDFLVWLLLPFVTFGIYSSWWLFSRVETLYRSVNTQGGSVSQE